MIERTYEDLCMDVKQIGERLGLEYEVIPMRDYKYKDGSTNDGKTREIRIVFRNTLLSPPLCYSYSISPYIWERFKKYHEEYEYFYNYLSTMVQRNLCYI